MSTLEQSVVPHSCTILSFAVYSQDFYFSKFSVCGSLNFIFSSLLPTENDVRHDQRVGLVFSPDIMFVVCWMLNVNTRTIGRTIPPTTLSPKFHNNLQSVTAKHQIVNEGNVDGYPTQPIHKNTKQNELQK